MVFFLGALNQKLVSSKQTKEDCVAYANTKELKFCVRITCILSIWREARGIFLSGIHAIFILRL